MKNNNPYVGGIPDCWYSGAQSDLWIEYKYKAIEIPKARMIPDLSKLQLRWIKDRQDEGRTIWVVYGTKKGGVVYHTPTEMEKGLEPLEFLERIQTRKEIATQIAYYTGGKDNADCNEHVA